MRVIAGRKVSLQIKTEILYWEDVAMQQCLEGFLLIVELRPLSMTATACQQRFAAKWSLLRFLEIFQLLLRLVGHLVRMGVLPDERPCAEPMSGGFCFPSGVL